MDIDQQLELMLKYRAGARIQRRLRAVEDQDGENNGWRSLPKRTTAGQDSTFNFERFEYRSEPASVTWWAVFDDFESRLVGEWAGSPSEATKRALEANAEYKKDALTAGVVVRFRPVLVKISDVSADA